MLPMTVLHCSDKEKGIESTSSGQNHLEAMSHLMHLIKLNDIVIVAVCRGDDESALTLLKQGTELLAASRVSFEQYEDAQDYTDLPFSVPPMAMSISITQYSKMHERDLAVVDPNERGFQTSPDERFQIFNHIFAVVLPEGSSVAIPHSQYETMYPLLDCVFKYNTSLVHHRQLTLERRHPNLKLVEENYCSAVDVMRQLYSSPNVQLNHLYAGTRHTLYLMLMASFNNLGQISSKNDCAKAAWYHERMSIIFQHMDPLLLTEDEYMFFFLTLSMPPGNQVAPAA